MKEFGNDNKESVKRTMLYLGIGEALLSYYGPDAMETFLGESFDRDLLAELAAAPLVEMEAAKVGNGAMVAILRTVLMEAFPEAVK